MMRSWEGGWIDCLFKFAELRQKGQERDQCCRQALPPSALALGKTPPSFDYQHLALHPDLRSTHTSLTLHPLTSTRWMDSEAHRETREKHLPYSFREKMIGYNTRYHAFTFPTLTCPRLTCTVPFLPPPRSPLYSYPTYTRASLNTVGSSQGGCMSQG